MLLCSPRLLALCSVGPSRGTKCASLALSKLNAISARSLDRDILDLIRLQRKEATWKDLPLLRGMGAGVDDGESMEEGDPSDTAAQKAEFNLFLANLDADQKRMRSFLRRYKVWAARTEGEEVRFREAGRCCAICFLVKLLRPKPKHILVSAQVNCGGAT